MDPLTAISLAGTVVQFVDFGCKLLKRSSQLYENAKIDSYSSAELSAEHVQTLAERTIKDLDQYKGKLWLGMQRAAPSEVADDETHLRALCSECSEVADTLVSHLSRLTVSVLSSNRKWKSFHHAFLSIWSEKDVQHLVNKLEQYRRAIDSEILLNLGRKINLHTVQQSDYFKALSGENREIVTALLKVQRSLGDDLHLQITALSHLLNQTIVVVADQEDRTRRLMVDILQDVLNPDLKEVGSRGIESMRKTETTIRKSVGNDLLQSLLFPTIIERFQGVVEAHSSTFAWLFQDPGAGAQARKDKMWSDFPEWLRNGSGIYWINGKAASGKSTLMKYICMHRDTPTHLYNWAAESAIKGPLYFASFFFWFSGTTEQKSQMGLMKSLLYDLLSQNHKLIPIVFPKPWSYLYSAKVEDKSRDLARNHWSLSQLKDGFKALLQQDQVPLKLCLFIDGLDEYEGDENEIAELFGEISQLPNVKCCVSSRPHVAFNDAFAGCPGLRLEDLTYPDIERFVTDKLQHDRRMQRLTTVDPVETMKLIQDIVVFADGVFLWVKLVVMSLLKGLGNRDQILDLRARLNSLPRDLEQLYGHMMARVDETYREEASRIFQLVATAASKRHDNWCPERSLTILGLAFAEEKNPNFAVEAVVDFIDESQANSLCEQMTHRLISRCGGLLEVQRTTGHSASRPSVMKVLYMHRTVKDYIERDTTREVLRSRTGNQHSTAFNPDLAILRSYVLQMKVLSDLKLFYCWDLISPAITFARRTDSDDFPCRVALLDELYTMGRYLVKKSGKAEELTVSVLRTGSSAYTFATECGLYKYLSALLDERNIIISTGVPSRSRTLLSLALVQQASYSPLFMSLQTVTTLLDHGAQPQTCWTFTLDHLSEKPWCGKFASSVSEQHEIEEWANIIIKMSQYGLRIAPQHYQILNRIFGMYPDWLREFALLVGNGISTPATPPGKEHQTKRKRHCHPQ